MTRFTLYPIDTMKLVDQIVTKIDSVHPERWKFEECHFDIEDGNITVHVHGKESITL